MLKPPTGFSEESKNIEFIISTIAQIMDIIMWKLSLLNKKVITVLISTAILLHLLIIIFTSMTTVDKQEAIAFAKEGMGNFAIISVVGHKDHDDDFSKNISKKAQEVFRQDGLNPKHFWAYSPMLSKTDSGYMEVAYLRLDGTFHNVSFNARLRDILGRGMHDHAELANVMKNARKSKFDLETGKFTLL
uniref:Uncharacterized protein n=1 Tax=Candidatus Kentrum sp. LPFa TaxID=2126335 RepID=A0A450WWI2_9GAMM|nr:MAG: hypothetical protein BECKLPF1236B_GA0070989_12552 [Candidatus Kentron sp. LPFa]